MVRVCTILSVVDIDYLKSKGIIRSKFIKQSITYYFNNKIQILGTKPGTTNLKRFIVDIPDNLQKHLYTENIRFVDYLRKFIELHRNGDFIYDYMT